MYTVLNKSYTVTITHLKMMQPAPTVGRNARLLTPTQNVTSQPGHVDVRLATPWVE